MVTHFETVRYAAFTGLGLLSLLAASLATLYTPAATALVQPQLKFSDWRAKALQSVVRAQWGDQNYVAAQCYTPQANDVGDPGNTGQTENFQTSPGLKLAHMSCLQVNYAAQSYHNYMRYFKSWADAPAQGWTQNMEGRPRGIALWADKTAVTGAWIDAEDVAATSAELDRTVHKVHLAMPHVGVMQAAAYNANEIQQPEDLDGQGIYGIRASVPSPVVHVTCAHLAKEDVSPLVYEEWSGINKTEQKQFVDHWEAPTWGTLPTLNETWGPSNATIMDSLFEWGGDGTVGISPETGEFVLEDIMQVRPVFPYLPAPGNTILNQTGAQGRQQIYVMGTVPRPIPNVTDVDTYLLCSIKTSLTGACSTYYNTTGPNEGRLDAICEDANDPWRYDKKYPQNSTWLGKPNLNWIWMAQEWGNSINLNDGRSGGGSNSRILTHLALTERELNSSMPSPAEALAVLAGSTLLLGMQDTLLTAPEVFVYPVEDLAAGTVRDHFEAEMRTQLYTSGIHANASGGFMVILFGVFFLNLMILVYFVYYMDFVTDYTEPQNMFAITLNSPPAREFAGACGGGPQDHQFDIGWRLAHKQDTNGDHLFLVPGTQTAHRASWRPRQSANQENFPSHVTPVFTPETPNSPFANDYEKFSKRRSLL